MDTQIGVGYSGATHSSEAGRQAAEEAAIPLNGQPADLVLVFFTPDLEPDQVLAGVRSREPRATLVAACSGGVIVPQGVYRQGVAVLALHSDEIQAYTGVVSNFSANPMAAGRALVQQVWSRVDGASGQRNGLLMALESTHDSEAMVEVVEAVGDEAGALYPLAGGRAIDDTRRHEHSLYLDGQGHYDAVSATLFLTAGPVGVGVRHGYEPLGNPLVVSRVDGNVLYELDGKTAFQAYAEQFPDRPDLTLENYGSLALDHPLGLPQMGREYIIRDPFATRPDGALVCAGALPEHSVVCIMAGDRESLLASARQAASDALEAMAGSRPALALVFSCITRLNYLGEAAKEEVEAIQEVIGPETPLFGAVTYGEIAAQSYSPPAFHNKAVVVGLIGAA